MRGEVRGASESEHELLRREYVSEAGSGEMDVEGPGESAGDGVVVSMSSRTGVELSLAGAAGPAVERAYGCRRPVVSGAGGEGWPVGARR